MGPGPKWIWASNGPQMDLDPLWSNFFQSCPRVECTEFCTNALCEERRPSRTNRITNRCGRIRNIFGRILLNNGIDLAGTMVFKSSVSRVTLGRNIFKKITLTKKMRYVRTSRMPRFSCRDLSYESENSEFHFGPENSLQMRNEPSESSLRSNRTICER